jgi:hypothetical protein
MYIKSTSTRNHVDCLLKMKNILYCSKYEQCRWQYNDLLILMLTHILVMTQLEKLLILQILQKQEHVI